MLFCHAPGLPVLVVKNVSLLGTGNFSQLKTLRTKAVKPIDQPFSGGHYTQEELSSLWYGILD